MMELQQKKSPHTELNLLTQNSQRWLKASEDDEFAAGPWTRISRFIFHHVRGSRGWRVVSLPEKTSAATALGCDMCQWQQLLFRGLAAHSWCGSVPGAVWPVPLAAPQVQEQSMAHGKLQTCFLHHWLVMAPAPPSWCWLPWEVELLPQGRFGRS